MGVSVARARTSACASLEDRPHPSGRQGDPSGRPRGEARTYRLPTQCARQAPVAFHHVFLPRVERVSRRLFRPRQCHFSDGQRECQGEGSRTFPSLVIRRAAENPVPVTANMTVRRPGTWRERASQLQALQAPRPGGQQASLIIPKGTRASNGTGCHGDDSRASVQRLRDSSELLSRRTMVRRGGDEVQG